MNIAQPAQYRKQLSKYHRHVIEDSDPLYIPGRAGTVVVIPADEYENILETMRVMADPITMKSIRDTQELRRQGKSTGISVEEAFRDLLESESK